MYVCVCVCVCDRGHTDCYESVLNISIPAWDRNNISRYFDSISLFPFEVDTRHPVNNFAQAAGHSSTSREMLVWFAAHLNPGTLT